MQEDFVSMTHRPQAPISDSATLHAFIADVAREKAGDLRLRLMHVEEYDQITVSDRLQEVEELIQQSERPTDVVFISADFPEDRIQSFIANVQKLGQGECCVFILVLRGQSSNVSTFADALLLGAHGTLSEPFSVKEIQEVTQHSLKLRTQLRGVRDRLALKLLMKDIIKAIDAVSQYQRLHKAPGESLRRLRELGESLKSARGRVGDSYFETIIDLFLHAPRPDFLTGLENYTGSSRAVQRRKERKLARSKRNPAE